MKEVILRFPEEYQSKELNCILQAACGGTRRRTESGEVILCGLNGRSAPNPAQRFA